MLTHIFLRFRRTPLPALGVLIFAAVLAAVLSGLHAANASEKAQYEQVYRTLPVKLTVTNLKGTKSDDLGIYSHYEDLFTGEDLYSDNLSAYIKDIQRKTTWNSCKAGNIMGLKLIGTSSVELCRELWPENGGAVLWADGYDESCLTGDQLVCLIPTGFDSDGDDQEDSGTITVYLTENQSYEFTIVGTVTGGQDLYCPYLTLKNCATDIDSYHDLDAMTATLKDNTQLEEFRQEMLRWFIEPDPSGMQVSMPGSSYQKYAFALDINDSQLRAAAETLENSLTVNRICTLLVFVLSAGAGFFVGFLMIRSRKREIALMRTLGEANSRVYLSFALEQMLCAVVGTVAGGTYFLWQPVDRLVLFCLIYFVGLSAALVVFLRGNLLSGMKEDE